MNIFRATICMVAFVGLVGAGQFAQAWHGYPPRGAWVYGSYRPAVGYRTSIGYGRFRGYHAPYRGLWTTRSYGWGGYGNLGFSATTRVRYGGGYRHRIAYRGWFPGYSWHAWHLPVTYSSFYGVGYWPYPYVTPTIYTPVQYPVIYSYPSCSLPTVNYSVGLSARAPSAGSALVGTTRSHLLTAHAVDGRVSQKPVTDEPSGSVPEDVLGAADAIFRAGGYHEAATAYAQLAVRFGPSDLLYGRRFVAQVASKDLEQAAITLASASATGFELGRADLPGSRLVGLGLSDEVVGSLTESLAAYALAKPEEALPLEMVSSWLRLSGDKERSEIFLTRAQQLSSPRLPDDGLADSKTEFVSLE